MAEKAQFTGVNEHFEAIFNAAEATQIVFQQPARTPFLFTPPSDEGQKDRHPWRLLGPCRKNAQQASQEGPCEAAPRDGFTAFAEHSSCTARELTYEAPIRSP